MLTFFSLMVGTLVSEDLTCISAGLLVQRGQIGASAAIAACALGIVAGDIGLWGLGRLFGRAALEWPWIARRVDPAYRDQLRSWLDRRAGWAIVASRFLPGTRLPLYVIAGFVRLSGTVFAFWALVGSLLWTPMLVLLTARLGDAFVARISPLVGVGWFAYPVTVTTILLVLYTIRCRLQAACAG
jgi:membrane protein DedA with SNARE-associated domain